MGNCVNSDPSYVGCNSAMWNRTGFAQSSQGGTLSIMDIMEGQCYASVDVGFPGLDTNINELIMAAKILEYLISLAGRLLARETHTWRALRTNWLSKINGMSRWVYQKVLMTVSGGQKAVQGDPRMEQGKGTVEEMAPEEYSLIGAVTGLMRTNMEPYLTEGSDCSETAKGVFSMRGSQDMLSLLREEPREKTAFLSCTNPFILSMVCWPTEDEDSSSDWSSESEDEDTAPGETVSLEGNMYDVQDVSEERIETQKEEEESSGTSVCWVSSSKDNMNDSLDSVSNWSEDSDDDGVGTSWDSGDETSCKDEGEDLWLSFCRSDDPYNPFSFAVPITKSIQTSDMQGPGLKNTPGACHTHSRLEEPNSENLVNLFHVPPKPFTKGHVQQANTISAYHSNCVQTKASAIATKASEDNLGCDSCPTKKVRFSPVVKVHQMIAWSYAHRAARRGPWEEHARDRCRFQRRITETESAIGYCLDPAHRELVRARLHGSLDMGVKAMCARDQLS